MPQGPQARVHVLHVIHDFLPRHQAGSEIYAFELCRELLASNHVTVLCSEYDPSRAHGHVAWRVHKGLPVVEIVNNWVCASFADTYRPPLVSEQIAHVLDAVQPDVVHVHSLLNLSFDIPRLARSRGIPVVATLHDYTLVCPSGGQRLHRAEQYVCRTIDTARCARCFPESPFHAQISFGAVASATRAPRAMQRAAVAMLRAVPPLARMLARAAGRAAVVPVSVQEIADRLTAARRVFDEVDLFVAPSRSIAIEFERLGIAAAKIRVSDYGFVPLRRGARNGARRPLRIGYAGTIVWHKGVHVLVDAVRNLPSSAYEVKIFGDPLVSPHYSADLRARAAGLPVHFMGAFDRERTGDVYAGIDVLVVPSLWLENSPLVIHEAFMAGVPVVAARIGGITDLVEHGRSGLLYDPESPAQLEAALRTLIERPEQLDRFARALPPVKPMAQDAREWEHVYEEVLERRRALSSQPA